MQELIQGTFHFHSTSYHDGRNTLREVAHALRERGFSFCVMTEHFEDFDEAKFDRYIAELESCTQSTGFILCPRYRGGLGGSSYYRVSCPGIYGSRPFRISAGDRSSSVQGACSPVEVSLRKSEDALGEIWNRCC